MKTLDFYFDYISPFAYLACRSLSKLDGLARLRYRPLLFAAVLAHHRTLGPAEIAPMRRFTYRHVVWLARRHGIPLNLPPAHPFNPLPLLRLTLALGPSAPLVERLFRFVWEEGRDCGSAADWAGLCAELGVAGAAERIADPAVKRGLREHTEAGLQAGVFGVPAFVVDGEVFWGFDAMDFLADYLRDPALLARREYRSADAVPVGSSRI